MKPKKESIKENKEKRSVKIVCYNASYKRIMLFEDVVSFSCDIREDGIYLECLDADNNKSNIRCTGFSVIG